MDATCHLYCWELRGCNGTRKQFTVRTILWIHRNLATKRKWILIIAWISSLMITELTYTLGELHFMKFLRNSLFFRNIKSINDHDILKPPFCVRETQIMSTCILILKHTWKFSSCMDFWWHAVFVDSSWFKVYNGPNNFSNHNIRLV